MAYQDTVIFRVSQLDGVAVSTTLQRDRTPLMKRMTGNLCWETTVWPESLQGTLRDKTSDDTKQLSVSTKKRWREKGFESTSTKAETNIGWLQDQGREGGRRGLIYQPHSAEIARDQSMVDWIIDIAVVPIWKSGLISHDPSQRWLCIGYSNPDPRCFGVSFFFLFFPFLFFSFFFFSLFSSERNESQSRPVLG